MTKNIAILLAYISAGLALDIQSEDFLMKCHGISAPSLLIVRVIGTPLVAAFFVLYATVNPAVLKKTPVCETGFTP